MNLHTPGPWRYEAATKTIRCPRNHWLATMDSWDGAVNNKANARLMIEAPAMLELIKELACVNNAAAAILNRIEVDADDDSLN